MSRILVVADDLTGANATGARFAERGLRTIVASNIERIEALRDDCDVLVANTASRHLPAEQAAALVSEAIARAGPVRHLVKRIDTTLRGNVGAELDAALDAAAATTGGQWRALVVPAFPDAGRITVAGLQLVDGVLLTDTEVVRDPLAPVTSSRVTEIVAAQSARRAREIHLPTVAEDPDALVAALGGDEPILVCDALSADHIDRIAAAAAHTGQRWLAVDPGPFGASLAWAAGMDAGIALPRLLVVAGSATALTRRQLARLAEARDVAFVDLDARNIDPAKAARAAAERFADHAIVGWRTAADADDIVDIDAETGEAIPHRLAEACALVLAEHEIGGLYTTGGDVTAAVTGRLGAHGLAVETEVLPLAVLGRLVGGPADGLPVVSKGGLIGDDAAAIACIDQLGQRVALGRQAVPA